jgi:apolipoprotein D and lipocalin family protein
MTTAKSTLALLLITLAACLCGGCVSNPPPQPVQSVDLDRYAGKWYEIARIPHLYEYWAVGDADFFTPLKEGKMRIIHRCHQETTYGYLREDVGLVESVRGSNNAKFHMQFGLAGVDVWVLALDPDYQYAVMGTPDRKSVWILSRKPVLPPDVDDKLFRLVDDLGYDIGQLRRTPQPMGL